MLSFVKSNTDTTASDGLETFYFIMDGLHNVAPTPSGLEKIIFILTAVYVATHISSNTRIIRNNIKSLMDILSRCIVLFIGYLLNFTAKHNICRPWHVLIFLIFSKQLCNLWNWDLIRCLQFFFLLFAFSYFAFFFSTSILHQYWN